MAPFWISLVAGATGGVLALAGQFVADRLTRAREGRGQRRRLVADFLALAQMVRNDVLVARPKGELDGVRLDVIQERLVRTLIELVWSSEGKLHDAVEALGEAVAQSVANWDNAAFDAPFQKAFEDLRTLGAALPS